MWVGLTQSVEGLNRVKNWPPPSKRRSFSRLCLQHQYFLVSQYTAFSLNWNSPGWPACWPLSLNYELVKLSQSRVPTPYNKSQCIYTSHFFCFSGKSFFKKYLCVYFWLCQVLVVACRIFPCSVQAPEHVGSVSVEPGLSCVAACGILVPWPVIEPVSPALEGRFLTTEPPEKSLQNLN